MSQPELRSETREFPESSICDVHQTGATGPVRKGLMVVLHWYGDEPLPRSAEVMALETDNSEGPYADIGLEWNEDGELSGYDGAFELPKEVLTFLRDKGYAIAADFEDEEEAPKPKREPEIQRCLIVSTANITQEDAHSHHAPIILGGLHGSMAYVPPPGNMPTGFSPEFDAILEHARGLGCQMVRFDCEGDTLEGFPTFDW